MESQRLDYGKLHLFIISPSFRAAIARPIANAAFSMWNEVWTEALRELDGVAKISSDEFTRHAQVAVLCYENDPIASVSFSPIDLSLPMCQNDSYFKVWPQPALDKLASAYPGEKVLIGCSFTVKKEWRRDSNGFSTKQLMMSLVIEHFMHSTCDAMVGTMRLNKGMGKLSYDVGANQIASGVIHHGVEVDLLMWDRQKMSEMTIQIPYANEAAEIYNRRIDYSLAALTEEKEEQIYIATKKSA